VETRPDSVKRRRQLRQKNSLRIICPNCGNDHSFFEVADGVILTSRYTQNRDGSFSQDGDESQIMGEVRFFCAECNEDLTAHHQRFVEMLF